MLKNINALLPESLHLREDSPETSIWAALFRIYRDHVQGPPPYDTWREVAERLHSERSRPPVAFTEESAKTAAKELKDKHWLTEKRYSVEAIRCEDTWIISVDVVGAPGNLHNYRFVDASKSVDYLYRAVNTLQTEYEAGISYATAKMIHSQR